jgi:hypothetical protein
VCVSDAGRARSEIIGTPASIGWRPGPVKLIAGDWPDRPLYGR